jgi:hypothetical protein
MKLDKRYLPSCYKLIIFLLFLQVDLITSAQPVKTMFPETNYPVINYSNMSSWAAHPWKSDPSDSIPGPLKPGYLNDSLADVFFIHPTTFTNSDDTAWNAAITDEKLNKKTDKSTILYQASVFNAECRVFAPRYRQAHIRSFFAPEGKSDPYIDTAYTDIRLAFEYYLANFNHGRPIIIASHSQGTLHAGRLLKAFFEGKPLLQQLICAYIIGLPVPENYFSNLQPCADSVSTGCFVSWRTFKSGYEPEYVKQEKFRAIVVNPLTWTLGEEKAPCSLNKGGILKNFNKIVLAVVNARVHKNVLWTSKPDVFGKIFLIKKNYHIGDYNLFYMNIRENIQTRINAYLKKTNS